AKNIVRHAEVRVIEKIEHFGAELQGVAFARSKFFERRDVQIDRVRASCRIAAQITYGERRIQRERRLIEPIVDGTRAITVDSTLDRNSGGVWTIRGLAGVRKIRGGLDGFDIAGLSGCNRIDLPSLNQHPR